MNWTRIKKKHHRVIKDPIGNIKQALGIKDVFPTAIINKKLDQRSDEIPPKNKIIDLKQPSNDNQSQKTYDPRRLSSDEELTPEWLNPSPLEKEILGLVNKHSEALKFSIRDLFSKKRKFSVSEYNNVIGEVPKSEILRLDQQGTSNHVNHVNNYEKLVQSKVLVDTIVQTDGQNLEEAPPTPETTSNNSTHKNGNPRAKQSEFIPKETDVDDREILDEIDKFYDSRTGSIELVLKVDKNDGYNNVEAIKPSESTDQVFDSQPSQELVGNYDSSSSAAAQPMGD